MDREAAPSPVPLGADSKAPTALEAELGCAGRALAASHVLAGFRRSGPRVVMLRATALRLLLAAHARWRGLDPTQAADQLWQRLLLLDELEAVRTCLSPAQRTLIAGWLEPSATRHSWAQNRKSESTAAVVLLVTAQLLFELLTTELSDARRRHRTPTRVKESRER